MTERKMSKDDLGKYIKTFDETPMHILGYADLVPMIKDLLHDLELADDEIERLRDALEALLFLCEHGDFSSLPMARVAELVKTKKLAQAALEDAS